MHRCDGLGSAGVPPALAITWNSKTAGKMPALPQNAAASIRRNSQPVRHQLERFCSFKLRHYGRARCVATDRVAAYYRGVPIRNTAWLSRSKLLMRGTPVVV